MCEWRFRGITLPQMKLPNAEHAFIDLDKLRQYVLNREHQDGRHKAKVFLSAVGLTALDAEWLAAWILGHLPQFKARVGDADEYGQRYEVDMDLVREGRSARIRTAWMVRRGESAPRLVTCYVL